MYQSTTIHRGLKYVSCNTLHEVTLQVNENLLRDGRTQHPVKDVR